MKEGPLSIYPVQPALCSFIYRYIIKVKGTRDRG